MRTMKITLDYVEIVMCADLGVLMRVSAMKNQRSDRFDWERDGWRQHIEGACAEFAVSKALNLAWTGVPLSTWHGAEVGHDVQVRLRPNPDQPDLGLKTTDDPEQRYVLVHGQAPEFELMGWCYGKDHPQPDDPFQGKTAKLWYVTPEALRPMEEF